MILDRTSHPVQYEAGARRAVGAMLHVLDGDGGIFTAAQVEAAVRPAGDRYGPRSRLVSVEQTTNIGGGRVWPQEACTSSSTSPHATGCGHLDGARLMNAVVASGVPAADHARGFDTAWLDFTKGLGAPVGAVLAASRELIDEAWRYKQMLGGAMRQAGVLAAAALHALDHHVERLATDHANARRLAAGLAEIDGVRIEPDRVETNIVIFEVADAHEICGRMWERGIQLAPLDAAITGGDTSRRRRRRHRARAGGVSSGSGGARRLKRPPRKLRGHQQHETGKPDLQPSLRDGVREHRAEHRAARRQHPDREPVRPPHVAVAGLAPGDPPPG